MNSIIRNSLLFAGLLSLASCNVDWDKKRSLDVYYNSELVDTTLSVNALENVVLEVYADSLMGATGVDYDIDGTTGKIIDVADENKKDISFYGLLETQTPAAYHTKSIILTAKYFSDSPLTKTITLTGFVPLAPEVYLDGIITNSFVGFVNDSLTVDLTTIEPEILEQIEQWNGASYDVVQNFTDVTSNYAITLPVTPELFRHTVAFGDGTDYEYKTFFLRSVDVSTIKPAGNYIYKIDNTETMAVDYTYVDDGTPWQLEIYADNTLIDTLTAGIATTVFIDEEASYSAKFKVGSTYSRDLDFGVSGYGVIPDPVELHTFDGANWVPAASVITETAPNQFVFRFIMNDQNVDPLTALFSLAPSWDYTTTLDPLTPNEGDLYTLVDPDSDGSVNTIEYRLNTTNRVNTHGVIVQSRESVSNITSDVTQYSFDIQ